MSKLLKGLLLITFSMLMLTAAGNATEWIVDDDGDPGTDFANLTTALATIGGYAGTHNIVVKEGSYSDEGLTLPANITSIVGDGIDLVSFTGSGAADFLNLDAAPAGFEISGMTISGYVRGLASWTGSGGDITGIHFVGNDYGIVFAVGATGFNVSDNCFLSSNISNTYDDDSNTWDGNYYDDYSTSGSYAIGGGGGQFDANPLILDNSVVSPTPVVFDQDFTVDIMWTVPECEADRDLAAYEFTVTYNASKVSFVEADYDYGFFGPDDGGDALYPGINGATAGQVTFAASNFTTPVTESGRIGTITFHADAANTNMLFTITSTYKDGDNMDIVVGNTPFLIALADNTAPELAVTVKADDDNDPSALIDPILDTYSDGSTAGSGPFVKMYVILSGTDDYDLSHLQYSWDGDPFATWGTYGSLSGMSFSSAAPGYDYIGGVASRPEGAHYFELKLVDAAGNESSVFHYDLTIDRTGPVITSIMLVDDDGCAPDPEYTNDPTVDVTIVDDGTAATMEFYQAGWEGPIAYDAAPQYTMAGPDGLKTVYMRQYDLWNNMGNQTNDQITLKTNVPAPAGFDVTPDRVAALTGVGATVTTHGGGNLATHYLISEDGTAGDDCHNAGWITPIPGLSMTFDLEAGAEGVRTVYYWSMDDAGNISPRLEDDVEYDITAPVLTLFDIQPVCSAVKTVTIDIEWTDNGGDANFIHMGEVLGTYTKTVDISAMTSPATVTFKVSDGEGDYTVYAVLEDDLGNVQDDGDALSDNVYFDNSNPTVTSVVAYDLDYGSVDPPVAPNWSNSADLNLEISGLSADVVKLFISEDGGSTFAEFAVAGPFTDPFVFPYTYAAPVEQANNTIHLYVEDCSGRNTSAALVTDGIYFDFPGASPPEVTSFTVSSADPTNVLSADLAVAGTDDWYATGLPWKMQIWEDGFQGAGSGWTDYATSYTGLVLDAGPGDGTRTINLLLSDPAGNVSTMATTTVDVDQTPPSGTVDIVSTNALAAPGYTNTASCELVLTWDADVDRFRAKNTNGGGTGGGSWVYVNPANSPEAWTISWILGLNNQVEVQFRDGAGNWGAIVTDDIYADGSVPAPPTSFTAAPHGSVELNWSTTPLDHKYFIKYNYNGDYPVFADPNPPAPAWDEGFPASGAFELAADEYPGTWVWTEEPHPDIYVFSIWVMNKCGSMSTAFTGSNLATSYYLGDFEGGNSPDGCLDYETEFFALASCYGSVAYSGYYDPMLDIAPTDDGTQMGIPIPDGNNNFDDFIIFALNYRDHRCGSNIANSDITTPPEKPVAPSSVAVTVEVPLQVNTGDLFTVPVSIEKAEALVGFHLILDYDHENLELVNVQEGAAFATLDESFFMHVANETNIDIVSVAMAEEYADNEVALVTFRSLSDAPIALSQNTIDLRDWFNDAPTTTFEMVTAKGTPIIPNEFALSQNYPNPFNPTTTIELSLPTSSNYTLEIYNVAGQLVESFTGYADAGIKTVSWDASKYSSGIYLYRLQAGSFKATKKMVLLK